jgi:hypothetical protein
LIKKNPKILKSVILPILIAVYFPLLNYANNAEIINLNSLFPMLGFYFLLAIIVYFLIAFFSKTHAYKTSLKTAIIIVFFSTYGIFFNLLNKQHVIDIEHYFLLPFFLFIGLLIIYLLSKIGDKNLKNIWHIFLIISIFLVSFNVLRIAPVELRKFTRRNKLYGPIVVDENLKPVNPDIYFIIFDEFAGFEAMRDYWQNPEVDDFVSYLQGRGFFVAEDSHSTNNTGDTLHQMAMRLNYEYYPNDSEKETLYEAIVDNQVMKILKEKGYQIITFDEIHSEFGYPARGPIRADINYENNPSIESYDKNIVFDTFGKLVTENSILSAISGFDKISYGGLEVHKNMIFFTVNELGNIESENPVFVYVHLLFPHAPFMFDENGHYVEQEYHTNWDYYLGNYKFSVKMLERMVDNILRNYDPEDQPVIILQSDHGARNSLSDNPDDPILEDYPEEFKALILNAIYLPYCNDDLLTYDMDPIFTFPIVFNCLFDAEIPLNNLLTSQ